MTEQKRQEGEDLWITFEDGLHVGVFTSEADAESLNEMRRRVRSVEPATVHYVPRSKLDRYIDDANTWRKRDKESQAENRLLEQRIEDLEKELGK